MLVCWTPDSNNTIPQPPGNSNSNGQLSNQLPVNRNTLFAPQILLLELQIDVVLTWALKARWQSKDWLTINIADLTD